MELGASVGARSAIGTLRMPVFPVGLRTHQTYYLHDIPVYPI
jgi:hypothetical protein